jgi:hypothetical protein
MLNYNTKTLEMFFETNLAKVAAES